MRSSIRLSVLLCLLGAGAAAHAVDKTYAIDAAASDVHWLVYKAGTFSRLGHNHVIAARNIQGNVTVDAANSANSKFEIVIPVAQIEIDNAALRGGLGQDFASVPSVDDIAGTRKNMLGERVLAGDMFPAIRLTGTGLSGAAPAQTLKVKVEILGRVVDLVLPTTIGVSPDLVEASGQFELDHADLGMQPFSVMMGALQVAPKLSFSYHIVARPVP
jgi:polyisoprenoid-binding protein YceI